MKLQEKIDCLVNHYPKGMKEFKELIYNYFNDKDITISQTRDFYLLKINNANYTLFYNPWTKEWKTN